MFRKFESRVLCFSFDITAVDHSSDVAGNVRALDMERCSRSSR